MKKENNKCTVCGSSKTTEKFKRIDKKTVFECHLCGSFFVNHNGDLKDFYNEKYFKGNEEVGYEDYDLRPSFDFFWQADLVNYFLKGNGTFLDVGCATGKCIENATYLGITSYGVELADYACNVAKSKGYDVTCGTLQSLAKRKFDAISFWEVVEHVKNPGELLKEAESYLESGGLIFISVPDATKKGPDWNGFKHSLEHVSYFTQDSMEYLLSHSFPDKSFVVLPFTDGVSSTLVAIAAPMNKKVELEHLKAILTGGLKDIKNEKDFIIALSIKRGLGSAKDFFAFVKEAKKNSFKELLGNSPARELVLSGEFREKTIPSLIKNFGAQEEFFPFTSPFWTYYSYLLKQDLGIKTEELKNYTRRLSESENNYHELYKSYQEVINSKGWKLILKIRKLLNK